jgi:hypothetical protein
MNKRDIERRYKLPKDATPEQARRINRNKTAAIWRANNKEKVRESAKKYREKAKEVEKLGREIISDPDAKKIEKPGHPEVVVTPLTDGPVLFFEALSYGSEADKFIIAAYREAEQSGRKVVGIISDLNGDIKGPYFTDQKFTQAIKDVYQEASKAQKAAGGTTEKAALVTATSSDDGTNVYITVDVKTMQ